MRRWFSLFLLLVLLPLQFSWAAVAAYCQHGEGHASRAGAAHQQAAGLAAFHEHAHDLSFPAAPSAPSVDGAAGDSQGDTSPQAGTPMDVDCGHGHCHGHCTALPPRQDALPGHLARAPHGTPADERGGVHAPAQPERPQWARLA